MPQKKQNISEHTKNIKNITKSTNNRLKVGGYFKTAKDEWSVKINGEWKKYYAPNETRKNKKYQEGSYVRTKDFNWHFVKNGELVRVYPKE